MAGILISEEILEFLEKKEFINAGTCDFSGRPNVAPKFLIKVEGDTIYLADYVIGKTSQNLKINPRVSLSTVNMDTLIGYQINGTGKIIGKGAIYERLLRDMQKKQIDFSVKRLVEGVHQEKKYKDFEVIFPQKVIFLKIKIKEIVKIGTTGKLERKNIEASACRLKPDK